MFLCEVMKMFSWLYLTRTRGHTSGASDRFQMSDKAQLRSAQQMFENIRTVRTKSRTSQDCKRVVRRLSQNTITGSGLERDASTKSVLWV